MNILTRKSLSKRERRKLNLVKMRAFSRLKNLCLEMASFVCSVILGELLVREAYRVDLMRHFGIIKTLVILEEYFY